jgi:hypothetical protein
MNSPRLRAYHNPENADESRVPDGWRFRYADEMKRITCHGRFLLSGGWRHSNHGTSTHFTYIVPVA